MGYMIVILSSFVAIFLIAALVNPAYAILGLPDSFNNNDQNSGNGNNTSTQIQQQQQEPIEGFSL